MIYGFLEQETLDMWSLEMYAGHMTDMTPSGESGVPMLHAPETEGQIETWGGDEYVVQWDPGQGKLTWHRVVSVSPDGKREWDPPLAVPIRTWLEVADEVTEFQVTEESMRAPNSPPPDIEVAPLPELGDPPPRVVGPPKMVAAAPDRSEMEIRFLGNDEDRTAREAVVKLRARFLQAARYLEDNTVASREQSLALTALEESMMWAVAAIVRRGVPA